MGFFEKFFKKKAAPVVPSSDKSVAEPKYEFNINTTTQQVYEERKPVGESKPELNVNITTRQVQEERKPAGELSRLDFGKPSCVLGCYLNYTPRVLCEPTERQLEFLHDLGVFIPEGVTKDDASCMISRATEEYDSLEGPSSELVDLAAGLKTQFSAFIGDRGLFRSVIRQASDRDRAALYAYGVRQDMHGRPFGNMLADPELNHFYSFADTVVTDPALLKSLKGRDPEDFKKPHRGTTIYKATAAHLAEI